ncbi:MAG: TerC/Alx family metal homeostasis membrane protein [Chlamydiales bacterium]
MPVETFHWVAFNLTILILLGLDFWRFYANPHPIGLKEALWTTLGWVSLAFLFNIWIYYAFGLDPALKFLTGYVLEESLSVDNLFIFLLIFSHFKVPEASKRPVLFYGVLGAIVMRALLIWAGIVLVSHFQWILELFAIFLIYIGLKLLFAREQKIDLEKNQLYRWLNSWMNVSPHYRGQKFFYKDQDKWVATPLVIVLIMIESIDLLFALDSVPAVLGITTDPFIVYTSNIFAILGLRSLFFVLEGLMKLFYLLHYAVAIILILIGCKMIAENFITIPIVVTLSTMLLILMGALIASITCRAKK